MTFYLVYISGQTCSSPGSPFDIRLNTLCNQSAHIYILICWTERPPNSDITTYSTNPPENDFSMWVLSYIRLIKCVVMKREFTGANQDDMMFYCPSLALTQRSHWPCVCESVWVSGLCLLCAAVCTDSAPINLISFHLGLPLYRWAVGVAGGEH